MSQRNWLGIPGDLPPDLQLLQLVAGKWASQAIYVAAELGVADLLKGGPRSSTDVARERRTDDDATYRLLRALSNLGVLEERDERTFALTAVGECLRSDVPGTMRHFARFVGYGPTWTPWGDLLHSVRTGEPAFEKVYGQNFFEWCGDDPEASAVFDEAMTAVSSLESEAVAAAFDFSAIGTLADVGGGRGHLLATILRTAPAMRGILFDLPHVVEGARTLLREHGVEARVRLEPGSFLETAPEGADAVVLKHIIHDWNDADAIRILRNCHRVLPPRARVLVVEALVPPPEERGWAKLLDLEMLVLTPRGRERTVEEYARLFEAAGFRLTRVVPTASAVSVVEGERI